MPKVAFFCNFGSDVTDSITNYAPAGYDVALCDPRASDAEKIEKVRDADFIIWLGGPLSGKVIESARRARLIQLLSAGFDNIDVRTADRLEVPVCNMGVVIGTTVAEHAVALMLAVLRRVTISDAKMRRGAWQGLAWDCNDALELTGATVGIVGLGNIGRTVAKRLQGWENTLLYADIVRYPDAEKMLGVRHVTLDELMRESDIVTVHVPLNSSTRGLIGKRELALMKPGAILVNTSRGPTVDEAALMDGLKAGKPAAAGLDVFREEPLVKDSPLRKMKNVVLTPHVAGNSAITWHRRGKFAFDNCQRVWEGKPPLSRVHQE